MTSSQSDRSSCVGPRSNVLANYEPEVRSGSAVGSMMRTGRRSSAPFPVLSVVAIRSMSLTSELSGEWDRSVTTIRLPPFVTNTISGSTQSPITGSVSDSGSTGGSTETRSSIDTSLSTRTTCPFCRASLLRAVLDVQYRATRVWYACGTDGLVGSTSGMRNKYWRSGRCCWG